MHPAPCTRATNGIAVFFLGSLIFALFTAKPAHAQGTPESLSFQGRLTDSGGSPIDAIVEITFRLYDDGTPIWTEVHPSVDVAGGIFNVILGETSPLDTVAFDKPLEIGITVEGDSEIAPRTPLASAPYALGMRGLYAVWAEDGDNNESYNIVGGSPENFLEGDVVGAVIAGGGGRVFGSVVDKNRITNGADYSNILGGADNSISGNFSTIAGGFSNWAPGHLAVIGGGQDNEATQLNATVAGGYLNRAFAEYATIGGGENNVVTGNWATTPGGAYNRAYGEYSMAAGFNAWAMHEGSFAWSDRSQTALEDSFATSAPNQFLIRAAGGVGINTKTPAHPLQVGTDATNGNGAHVTAAGDWVNGSSVEFKTGFREIDKEDLLERLAKLSVTQWHYKGHEHVNHIGATAEEFRATFGLGHDPRFISTVDADGVALAAIQALYERVVALEAELEALRKR